MRAMTLERIGRPLAMVDLPVRPPAAGQLLIRVRACGVCRTDQHICDGDLPVLKTPLVLGHEVVGVIEALGPNVHGFAIGERVGVPWLGWTCGICRYCRSHRENLCDEARFTGYQIDGGYSEIITADARYCFPLPAILFAPVGDLVPIALRAIHKGGTVVCAGIHMSAIPAFPSMAPRIPVRTKVETYSLGEANEALARLRSGALTGGVALTI